MKGLNDIKEKLCRELEEYAMNDLSAGSLETIHKLTDTIKNINAIENEPGYSKDKYSRRYYNDGNSYTDNDEYSGYSGRHWVRGHYSRAGAKELLMEELENTMSMTSNNKEKDIIRKAIDSLERI